MTIYGFYIFDRHCECIYVRNFQKTTTDRTNSRTKIGKGPKDSLSISGAYSSRANSASYLSVQDDAKLVFGVIFSLRNMIKKLAGPDENFIAYRTGDYKLHYYETPTQLKFVVVTDVKTDALRVVLHQIYVNLYVEYVVKNPLSPVDHSGGEGVYVQYFELGLQKLFDSIDV